MRLTDQQIEETYRLIEQHHQEFLVSQGVRLPRLRQAGQYTKYALTLVYLAQGYPHTRTVSKKELTEFIRQYYPDVNDVQQARHLGAQQGWCILSGERNDLASEGMKSGEYRLQTLEECYPGFTAERREEQMDADYWEALKAKYDYRCACCAPGRANHTVTGKIPLPSCKRGTRTPAGRWAPAISFPNAANATNPTAIAGSTMIRAGWWALPMPL